MKKKTLLILLGILLLIVLAIGAFRKFNFNTQHQIGKKIDSLNGVYVYYNGGVSNVVERNLTTDNYNLGLKYQCVEFVKRYYYEYLHHKMPDSYGHAKHFYNPALSDGENNASRNLTQYENPSSQKPKEDDLVIFGATMYNPYGHVAIIAKVTDSTVEIIQQNAGAFADSRATYPLIHQNKTWKIDNTRILGWLRKEDNYKEKK